MNMPRRVVLNAALAFAVVPSLPALADEVLTAEEIKTMLTGNTILGTWNGDPYRQLFKANGITFYAPKTSRSSRGEWRVNAETNEYESWWEQSGWAGYQIIRRDGNLYWTSKNTSEPQPFEVLAGDQLVWPQ